MCFHKPPNTLTHLARTLVSGCLRASADMLQMKNRFACPRSGRAAFVCVNALRRDVEALIRADPSPLQYCVWLITGEMGLSNTWSIPASDPSPRRPQTHKHETLPLPRSHPLSFNPSFIFKLNFIGRLCVYLMKREKDCSFMGLGDVCYISSEQQYKKRRHEM